MPEDTDPRDGLHVERTRTDSDRHEPARLTAGGLFGGVVLTGSGTDGLGTDDVLLSLADLLWLVTTGGPAMIALLGGPLAIKGADGGR